MSKRMSDVITAAWGEVRFEPIEKRVRADDAVDSTRALLVWEPRRVVPSYAVPAEDISADVTAAPVSVADVAGAPPRHPVRRPHRSR